MPDLHVRAATLADRAVLEVLERRHFPAVPGRPHSGYLFGDSLEAHAALDESFSAPRHVFVSVAEVAGAIEGFAMALPFSLPGTGQLDQSNALLQFVAVNEEHRRAGVGRALLEHIEARLTSARQNVVVAHVPASSADFYRAAGWLVMAPTAGFAWLPFNDFLRADFPDPEIGYEHMAAKVLRPRAVRRWFGFPQVSSAPTADATLILEALVARGDIALADLDEGTLQMLAISQVARSREGRPRRI